jgi:hypothetical protein
MAKRQIKSSLILALSLLIFGCIYIPTPALSTGECCEISSNFADWIKPGKSTRAEILLHFGDPEKRLEDDKFFVYGWEKTHGYVFIGAYVTGVAIPTNNRHFLLIEFDADGIVRRSGFIDPSWAWQDTEKMVEQWKKQQQ